jgi:hypothetical protein
MPTCIGDRPKGLCESQAVSTTAGRRTSWSAIHSSPMDQAKREAVGVVGPVALGAEMW